MVGKFLANPRRSPRAAARCRARILLPGTAWDAPTEDVGPRGCRLVVPQRLETGAQVRVALRTDAVPDQLVVAGRVAWAARTAPFRVGIAFVEGAVVASTRWFEQLLSARPELSDARRMASHLPLDAMIFLGRPPKYLIDFSRDEAAVLRHVASGVTVRELRYALRGRPEEATRAIFSLLARQHLTLSRGASVHPTAWRRILADLEASFAAEALLSPRAPLPSRPPSRAAAASNAMRAPEPTPSRRLEGRAAYRRLDAGASWASDPDAPRPRPPEAQGAYDRALSELAAGRTDTALILLRRANALAPGDAEIGRTLAEVGFRQAIG
ncbi:MAG TPA: PilZ domain-containing protein [Anaeromyxobacteraceae bacterium]|nr:PilZ domain-containing protein [Anaeromyxobacteraceae bacterium]